MIFSYAGIDANGKKVSDKLEATTLEEAKSKLKAQKIIYKKLQEEQPSIFDSLSFTRRYRISAAELSQLSRELAMYVKSGITIVNAIKVVQVHYVQQKKLNLFLQTISTHLDEGQNFYSALEAQSIVKLPEFYKQSIKVSEDGGILDEVLLELSRFLKEQERISKEIKSAFAYPTFMVIISLIMVGFMLTFVVPKIVGIFDNLNQELPTVTKIVISLSDFFSHNFVLLLSVITLVILSIVVAKKVNYTFAYWLDSLFLRLPLFGAIRAKSELARFAYIASLLVRSGVPLVQTISLSSNIIDNRVYKKLFQEAAKRVVEGKRLSQSLMESSIKIDNAFIQSIALGEETSQIEPVLSNISELYFEQNRDKTAVLLALLSPMLMLFVGGSIGFIVAAMLLPIFSMSVAG